MKRYIIPGILAALLTVSLLPAPTYTYVVRELSQTFTAVQTFSAGMALASGQKLYLNGASTDDYIIWDEDNMQAQVFVNGNLSARVTEHGTIPGACPDNLWDVELGTSCFDTEGRAIYSGNNGPIVIETGRTP